MAIVTGTVGIDNLNGGVEDDLVSGLDGDDTLHGGAGRDLLVGDDLDAATPDGNDTLFGGDDRDYLSGGGGSDHLYGEAGDDSLYSGMASPPTGPFLTVDGGDDDVDGGAGVDNAIMVYVGHTEDIRLDNSNLSITNIITKNGARAGSLFSIENLTFYSGSGNDVLTGSSNFDFLLGGAGNDTLNGGGLSGGISNGQANDTLNGGGLSGGISNGQANDTLNGGLGNDRLDGGLGQDTAAYDLPGNTAGVSVDLRIVGPQNTGGQGVDELISIENLGGGYGSDVLHGDDGDGVTKGFNQLYDNFGGADQLYGHASNDVLTVTRNSGSTAAVDILMDGGDGFDIITFSGTKTNPKERVTLIGGADNQQDNLVASGFAQAFIDAGGGNDNLFVDNIGSSQVTLGQGADTLNITAPGAKVANGVILVFDFHAELGDTLKLTGSGNYLTSALTGYTAGDNPFGAGYLKLLERTNAGGGTNTVLQVDRDGAFSGYQFTDLLVLQNVTAQQAFGVAANGLGGSVGGFAVVASPAIQPPQSGGTGADTLTGGAGNDVLIGLDGNDTFRAGGGSNTMEGGNGLDTVVYGGVFRAYVGTVTPALLKVTGGPEGVTDLMTGMERLKFADGYFAVGPNDVAAQVYRLYHAALTRDPDSPGLASWAEAIEQKGTPLLTIANGFIGSPEFLSRYGATTDTQYVTLLYNNVLGRDPDATGLAGWLGALSSQQQTRAQVLVGFSESPEYILATTPGVQTGLWVGDTAAATVQRLYDTVFNRFADVPGLTAWSAALHSGQSLQTVAAGFVNAPEFQSTYGALNNGQFVEQLYQNVLGRPSDAQGLATWTSALANGTTRANVVLGFSESPEHVSLMAPYIDYGLYFS